jgi:hypothetical protein
MKVFVTKYALTKGIQEAEGRETETEGYFYVTTSTGIGIQCSPKEWHRDRASAVARVLEMIAAKRKSIKKSLASLDKLEREVTD